METALFISILALVMSIIAIFAVTILIRLD